MHRAGILMQDSFISIVVKAVKAIFFAVAISVCAVAEAYAQASSIGGATGKQDIRGFHLGMPLADAFRVAQEQCKANSCRADAPHLCKVNQLRDVFAGGDDTYFDSTRQYGDRYNCRFDASVMLQFSSTPTTKKIYKLRVAIKSQMNCKEILSYIKDQFGLAGEYVIDWPKDKSGHRCDRWVWHVTPDYELTVLPDTASSFHIIMTDAEVIKQNERDAEESRKKSVTKPRL